MNKVRKGDMAILDKDHPNSSTVKVIQVTPREMFATVENSEGHRWGVMYSRLTHLNSKQ